MRDDPDNKASAVVIDDEESVREGCRQTLEAGGYKTWVSGDGNDGVAVVDRVRPDVVLVDLRLPGKHGMDVLADIRAIDEEIAPIVITAYGTIASAVNALKLGARDYIEKPITPEKLMEAVERAVRAPRPEADVERLPHQDDSETLVIKLILRKAARDGDYGQRLVYHGAQELAGWALSPEARQALQTGDRAWIWKRCGWLTPEEREWLDNRPW